MQTQIPSPRHWEWPGGCYSMAASPPSCHPAHSLFFNALHCIRKRRPILTHISHALVSPGASPEDVKTVGSCSDTASTRFDHLQLHTSLLSRQHQLRQTWDQELWQYRTIAARGGKEYAGGGAWACSRQAKDCLCEWVSYCSHCCGETYFHTTDQGDAIPVPIHLMFFQCREVDFIPRKYFIKEWMQGIDFFVRSIVFLSRDVFQIYEDFSFLSPCLSLKHRQLDWPWQSCFVVCFFFTVTYIPHEQTHSCLIYFFFFFPTRQLNLKLCQHQRAL